MRCILGPWTAIRPRTTTVRYPSSALHKPHTAAATSRFRRSGLGRVACLGGSCFARCFGAVGRAGDSGGKTGGKRLPGAAALCTLRIGRRSRDLPRHALKNRLGGRAECNAERRVADAGGWERGNLSLCPLGWARVESLRWILCSLAPSAMGRLMRMLAQSLLSVWASSILLYQVIIKPTDGVTANPL